MKIFQCWGGEWSPGYGERWRGLVSGQSGQGEQRGVDPGEDGALSLVQMVEILSCDWWIVDTLLCCVVMA